MVLELPKNGGVVWRQERKLFGTGLFHQIVLEKGLVPPLFNTVSILKLYYPFGGGKIFLFKGFSYSGK